MYINSGVYSLILLLTVFVLKWQKTLTTCTHKNTYLQKGPIVIRLTFR